MLTLSFVVYTSFKQLVEYLNQLPNDPSFLESELLGLRLLYERGKISREAYKQAEAEILKRLKEAKERKKESALEKRTTIGL